MLLHGNLMCWRQFEDLIPLLERKFCVYAVSFDGFDGTGETTYTTARDQADKLAAYIEKELDGQLDLLLQSRWAADRLFSEGFPNRSDRSDDPQRAGVSGFRSAESTDFEGHAAKAISNGTRKVHACMGTALYGADGAGNADYAPPYPGSYQLGIRPGHLGGRTLSLSNGLFGTARCKGRLLVRRKRRAYEKAIQRLRTAYPSLIVRCFPISAMARSSIIRHCLCRRWSTFWQTVRQWQMRSRIRKVNTMKVTTLDEKSIRDIGHAFGYYDYEEETGMSAAFSGKEATANYICAYVRGVLRGGFLHTTSERGEGYIALQAAKGEDGTQDDVAHRLRNAAQLHPEAPFAIWYCQSSGAGLPCKTAWTRKKKPLHFSLDLSVCGNSIRGRAICERCWTLPLPRATGWVCQ